MFGVAQATARLRDGELYFEGGGNEYNAIHGVDGYWYSNQSWNKAARDLGPAKALPTWADLSKPMSAKDIAKALGDDDD